MQHFDEIEMPAPSTTPTAWQSETFYACRRAGCFAATHRIGGARNIGRSINWNIGISPFADDDRKFERLIVKLCTFAQRIPLRHVMAANNRRTGFFDPANLFE